MARLKQRELGSTENSGGAGGWISAIFATRKGLLDPQYDCRAGKNPGGVGTQYFGPEGGVYSAGKLWNWPSSPPSVAAHSRIVSATSSASSTEASNTSCPFSAKNSLL